MNPAVFFLLMYNIIDIYIISMIVITSYSIHYTKVYEDEQGQNFPAIMAANTLMLTPLMIMFFSMQKFFVQSLVSSGIKG